MDRVDWHEKEDESDNDSSDETFRADSYNFNNKLRPELAGKELGTSSSDDEFRQFLESQDFSENSSCADLSELNEIREDIDCRGNSSRDPPQDQEDSNSEDEDEEVKWQRISKTVERMKMLLLKYPKFTGRVSNDSIITALHAMMDTLEAKASGQKPTSVDVRMVEEQMENFKSVLFAGIDNDIQKWKSQKKSLWHYFRQFFSIAIVIVAIISYSIKSSS